MKYIEIFINILIILIIAIFLIKSIKIEYFEDPIPKYKEGEVKCLRISSTPVVITQVSPYVFATWNDYLKEFTYAVILPNNLIHLVSERKLVECN